MLFVLALFFFFGQEKFLWSDSGVYVDLGQKIAGVGLYDDPIRTPLYPLLISIFLALSSGYGLLVFMIFQAFISSLSTALVYKIVQMFSRGSRMAFIAAAIFAFEPLAFLLNSILYPEAFLLFFLLLFVYMFLQYQEKAENKYLLYSALALTLAVWTKPVASYLWIVPVVILILGKKYRASVMYALIVFIALLPLLFFNVYRFRFLGISQHGEGNVCGYFLTSVYSTQFGTDPSDMNVNLFPSEFLDAQKRCFHNTDTILSVFVKYPQSFTKAIFLSTASMVSNDGYTSFFYDPARASKAHHNYLTPVVFADKDWKTKIPRAASELSFWQFAIVILGKVFWLSLFFTAVIGAWKGFTNKTTRASFLFLILCTLYFIVVTVLSTGYGVGARLRYPIMPLELIFTAYLLARGGWKR